MEDTKSATELVEGSPRLSAHEEQEATEAEVKEAQNESLNHPSIPSKDIWPAIFQKAKSIVWDDFVKICKRKNHEGLIYKADNKFFLNVDPTKIGGLRILLEPLKDSGPISKSNFDNLLKWFTPLIPYSPYINEDEIENGWTFERIARLAEQEWFYGWLPQDIAQDHLRGDPPGTFLIRFSSSIVGGYSLDIIDNKGTPTSWRIKPTEEFNTFVIPGIAQTYKGLASIIAIHKKDLLGESQVTLTQPVPHNKYAPINDDQEKLQNWLDSYKLRELFPLLKQKGVTLATLGDFKSNELETLNIPEPTKTKLKKAIDKHIAKPHLIHKASRDLLKRRKYKILV